MTYQPYIIFCLKCNIKTHHNEEFSDFTTSSGCHYDTILVCIFCGRICDNIPCISQITIEGYLKKKKLKKEHDEAIDYAVRKNFQEMREQLKRISKRNERNKKRNDKRINKRNEKREKKREQLKRINKRNKKEKSVWHRAMQFISKWWRACRAVLG